MGVVSLEIESAWLDNFTDKRSHDIFYSSEAEKNMELSYISRLDILYVLKTGKIVEADKYDAEGAIWWIDGETCDCKRLVLAIDVDVNRIRIKILSVNCI